MSLFQDELKEAFSTMFDRLVDMAMDETAIPTTVGNEECETERFVAATEDERRAALELYPATQMYLARRFGHYVEDERDLVVDEMLKGTDEETKCEVLLDFVVWYGTVCLRDFLTDNDCSFNPLYLCEWCNGLAVMYVQNEQLLREKITRALLRDLFSGTGVSSSDFLVLPFEKQCEFYKTNQGLVVAIFQALGNSLPDDVALPA